MALQALLLRRCSRLSFYPASSTAWNRDPAERFPYREERTNSTPVMPVCHPDVSHGTSDMSLEIAANSISLEYHDFLSTWYDRSTAEQYGPLTNKNAMQKFTSAIEPLLNAVEDRLSSWRLVQLEALQLPAHVGEDLLACPALRRRDSPVSLLRRMVLMYHLFGPAAAPVSAFENSLSILHSTARTSGQGTDDATARSIGSDKALPFGSVKLLPFNPIRLEHSDATSAMLRLIASCVPTIGVWHSLYGYGADDGAFQRAVRELTLIGLASAAPEHACRRTPASVLYPDAKYKWSYDDPRSDCVASQWDTYAEPKLTNAYLFFKSPDRLAFTWQPAWRDSVIVRKLPSLGTGSETILAVALVVASTNRYLWMEQTPYAETMGEMREFAAYYAGAADPADVVVRRLVLPPHRVTQSSLRHLKALVGSLGRGFDEWLSAVDLGPFRDVNFEQALGLQRWLNFHMLIDRNETVSPRAPVPRPEDNLIAHTQKTGFEMDILLHAESNLTEDLAGSQENILQGTADTGAQLYGGPLLNNKQASFPTSSRPVLGS